MRQTALAYAQVRIQARHAARPSEAEWQVIETGRGFTQTLDAVKRTSLASFVARLGSESDIPAIEQGLYAAWGELVTETANWAPLRWRPALNWLKPLPYLRLGQATFPPGLLSPVETRLLTGDDAALAQAWQREFTNRLPQDQARLEDDVNLIWARYTVGPARSAADTAALAARLDRTLRRHPQEPSALFAWLGLAGAHASNGCAGRWCSPDLFRRERPAEAV